MAKLTSLLGRLRKDHPYQNRNAAFGDKSMLYDKTLCFRMVTYVRLSETVSCIDIVVG